MMMVRLHQDKESRTPSSYNGTGADRQHLRCAIGVRSARNEKDQLDVFNDTHNREQEDCQQRRPAHTPAHTVSAVAEQLVCA